MSRKMKKEPNPFWWYFWLTSCLVLGVVLGQVIVVLVL